MHPIDSMNNLSNKSTKRSPERSPTINPAYVAPRTAESRGDTVTSFNPFSMTNLNDKESVEPLDYQAQVRESYQPPRSANPGAPRRSYNITNG